jgi:hypothetical protein
MRKTGRSLGSGRRLKPTSTVSPAARREAASPRVDMRYRVPPGRGSAATAGNDERHGPPDPASHREGIEQAPDERRRLQARHG